METHDNSFNGTALDGHVLKFNWTFHLPQQRGRERTSKQNFVYDYENVSSEFSISKTCLIKWKMICQKMSHGIGSKSFKIGLMRTDSEHCKVDVFFSVKINFSNTEETKKDSAEFNFSRKGEQSFTQVMELHPNCVSRKGERELRYGGFGGYGDYQQILVYNGIQNYAHNTESTGRNFCITGFIITENCCKTVNKEDVSMDENISQMQQDFKTFHKNNQIADVSLNVRNESLPAHKFVLTARSPVFRRMFSQDLTEKQLNTVQIDDIEKSVMEAFLLFLYTGVLEDRAFRTVFELYSVADKYEVITLFKTCRDILMSCVSIQTVTPLLKLADMHSDGELKDFAVKYICDNFSKVETTAEWEELLDTSPRLASYTLRRVSTNISK